MGNYDIKIISYKTYKNGGIVPEYQIYFGDEAFLSIYCNFIKLERKGNRLILSEVPAKIKGTHTYTTRISERRIQVSGKRAKSILGPFVGIYTHNDVQYSLGPSDRTIMSITAKKEKHSALVQEDFTESERNAELEALRLFREKILDSMDEIEHAIDALTKDIALYQEEQKKYKEQIALLDAVEKKIKGGHHGTN